MKKSVKEKERKTLKILTPKNKYSGVTPEFNRWFNQMIEEDKEIIKALAKRYSGSKNTVRNSHSLYVYYDAEKNMIEFP